MQDSSHLCRSSSPVRRWITLAIQIIVARLAVTRVLHVDGGDRVPNFENQFPKLISRHSSPLAVLIDAPGILAPANLVLAAGVRTSLEAPAEYAGWATGVAYVR